MFTYVFLFVLLINAISALTPKILGLYDCDVEKKGILEDFNLQTEYMNGFFSMKLETPFDIDDDIQLKITAKEYKNDDWEDTNFEDEITLCDVLEIFIPTLWGKIAKKINLKSFCPYSSGKYDLKDFQVDVSDIDYEFKKAMHELFIVNFYKGDSNEPFACRQLEIKVV